MDGERSGTPAGQAGGFVPPDMEMTQRLRTVQVEEPAMVAKAPQTVPNRPLATPRPIGDTRVAVPASPPRPPATRRGRGPGKGVLGAAVAAMGIVVLGAGVAGLTQNGSPKPSAASPGAANPARSSAPASAPARTQPGTPSAGGSPASAPAAAGLSKGRFVSYSTTQREQGYFEGVLMLTNRTGAPLTGWQMSFSYPGANVKNIWGGVLVQGGANPIIKGDPAAGPIPVGGTVQVRFGAAGTPSAPQGCTLNSTPC